MASNFTDMTVEQRLQWTETISKRLDIMYKELCEFEALEQTTDEEDDPIKLLDLLSAINDMQSTAHSLRPVEAGLASQQQDLKEQMELLQNSIDLLTLENETQQVEVMKE